MPVRGHDCRAGVRDRGEIFLAGECARVALIKVDEVNARQFVRKRLLKVRQERDRVRKAVGEERHGFTGKQLGRCGIRLDRSTRHTAWIQEFHLVSLACSLPTQRPQRMRFITGWFRVVGGGCIELGEQAHQTLHMGRQPSVTQPPRSIPEQPLYWGGLLLGWLCAGVKT